MRTRYPDRSAELLIVVVIALNYARTAWFFFSNDDFIWIAQAHDQSASLKHFLLPWGVFFRPLIQLSFVFNYYTSGLHAAPYHATNVALHAATSCLAFHVAREVTRNRMQSVLAALAFAVFPWTSEAVAWISGRTEAMCGLFCFIVALLHLRGARWWALAVYPLALASKETAICVPLLVLLCEWYRRGLLKRSSMKIWATYAAVTGIYLLLRKFLLNETAWGIAGLSASVPLSPAIVQFLVRSKLVLITQYLLEPFPLHAGLQVSPTASGNFVGFFPTSAVIRSVVAAAVVIIGAVLAVGSNRRETRTSVIFASGWLIIALLPYIFWRQFMPWYVYLASFGSCLLFVLIGGYLISFIPNAAAQRMVAVAVFMLWFGASVARLQINIEHEQRASTVTSRTVAAITERAPVQPHTRFVVLGAEYLRAGTDPWVGKSALGFGTDEAARLWLNDPTIDVQFAVNSAAIRHDTAQPTVILLWDSSSHSISELRSGPDR